jgi:hypothetical protein
MIFNINKYINLYINTNIYEANIYIAHSNLFYIFMQKEKFKNEVKKYQITKKKPRTFIRLLNTLK